MQVKSSVDYFRKRKLPQRRVKQRVSAGRNNVGICWIFWIGRKILGHSASQSTFWMYPTTCKSLNIQWTGKLSGEKLQVGHYTTPKYFAKDVHLIFENYKTYYRNKKSSPPTCQYWACARLPACRSSSNGLAESPWKASSWPLHNTKGFCQGRPSDLWKFKKIQQRQNIGDLRNDWSTLGLFEDHFKNIPMKLR